MCVCVCVCVCVGCVHLGMCTLRKRQQVTAAPSRGNGGVEKHRFGVFQCRRAGLQVVGWAYCCSRSRGHRQQPHSRPAGHLRLLS